MTDNSAKPYSRTRIKICGITRPQDGVEAGALGADAIGLNFYAPSPRAVDPERALLICRALPPFVKVVGIFVDESEEVIRAVLDAVPLDLLQFHGAEEAGECERYGRPYIKSIAMRSGVDAARRCESYPSAAGILLDTWRRDTPGGSGRAFDWSLVPAGLGKPVILAGGLNAGNVGEAVRRVRPFAVDVSGGVEASKGIKDPRKMAEFIGEVRLAGASQ